MTLLLLRRLFFILKSGNDPEMKTRSIERDFVIFPEENGKIRLPDAGAFANRNDKTTSVRKINENSESISCHRIEHGG